MNGPRIAWFETVENAQDWRHEHGGWIFDSEGGPALWFALGFTPSAIFTHPATSGLSGKLM
jgi:hypothetical protein